MLREALGGTTRFADFRDALGIAPDVLTARLATLVDAGVMDRRPYREPGQRPRHEYVLTDAGRELVVVLGALQQWGDRHVPHPGGATVERRHRRTGRELHVDFVDERGRAVAPGDVEMVRTASYPVAAGAVTGSARAGSSPRPRRARGA